MARFALTASLRPGRTSLENPVFVTSHVADAGTSGNVYIAFDNTVILTQSDLRAAVELLVSRCQGLGGLKQ